MRPSNIKRAIKIKILQIKADFLSSVSKPQPYNKKQFLADCANNSLIVDSVRGAIKPAEFSAIITDELNLLAQVTKVPGERYYSVKISRPALLEPCFDFLEGYVVSYYNRRSATLDVDRDLFHRMCLTCAINMAFWHEAAHVICGHLDYAEAKGPLPTPDWTDEPASFEPWLDTKRHPLLPTRTIELDADIYGAQFALSHVMHSSDVFRKVRRETFLEAFGIGVRGLFEFLTWGRLHEAPGATVPHPAPITRAYIAITHAIARLDKMRAPPQSIERLQQHVQAVLLDFEFHDLGMTVNPKVLTAAQQTELALWSKRHKEFVPFQPISSNRKAAAR